MDRRKFLKTTALTGAAGASALSSASCSSLKFLPTGSIVDNQLDMTAYLAVLDEGMHRISQWDPVDEFTGTTSDSPNRSAANRVARNAYKSLYVTAMFSDLSPDDQMHPGVQARVRKSLPEMHLSAVEMKDFLDGENGVDAETLQDFVNQDDDPGMRFLEQFNDHAHENGVSRTRRAQTRIMATNMLWRLKNQPPDLVTEEINAKMEKLASSAGDDAAVRHFVATKVSEDAFWQWQQWQATAGQELNNTPGVYANWTDTGQEETEKETTTNHEFGTTQESENNNDEPEKSLAQRGARQMGIGLALLATGGVLVAAGAFPGVFVGTVGAVYFLVGLVKLLIAGISGGDSSPEPA